MAVAVTLVVDRVRAELVSLDLFDLGATAVGEAPRDDGLITLTAGFDDDASARAAVARLGSDHATIDESADVDGWVETQRDALTPTEAGEWIVRAPWHPRSSDSRRRDLVIDPGRAFGHGGHPTTALLLDLMPTVVRPSMRALDLGTGTGVLALAAASLGASVIAVEKDLAAVEVARLNLARNGVTDLVALESADAASGPRHADIAFANVTIDVHRSLAPTLDSVPLVLVSGILEEQFEEAQTLYDRPVLELRRAERWVAACLGSEPVLAR